MANVLPRLRSNLDILPSPAPEQPGLFLRDPFHYTEALLVIPPALIPALAFLNGENTALDLQADLCRRTGQLVGSEVVENFVQTLNQHGFLETEDFTLRKESRQREFREAAERLPVHAGTGYPEKPEELRTTFQQYFRGVAETADPPGMLGLAAPHVSPAGGWRCYASAYARLNPELAEKTFVVLGTSHFGQPERFGLTR